MVLFLQTRTTTVPTLGKEFDRVALHLVMECVTISLFMESSLWSFRFCFFPARPSPENTEQRRKRHLSHKIRRATIEIVSSSAESGLDTLRKENKKKQEKEAEGVTSWARASRGL